jgi:hypothetical protein
MARPAASINDKLGTPAVTAAASARYISSTVSRAFVHITLSSCRPAVGMISASRTGGKRLPDL